MGWGGGGVMLTFLALAPMVDATQRIGWGWGGGVDVNVPCTCRHGGCYATHGVVVLMLMFLALVIVMLKFNVPRRRAGKASLHLHTGAIDGWWRRAKDSIPSSLHTLLGNGAINPKVFPCVQQTLHIGNIQVQILWQRWDNRSTN